MNRGVKFLFLTKCEDATLVASMCSFRQSLIWNGDTSKYILS